MGTIAQVQTEPLVVSAAAEAELLPQETFSHRLHLEQRRTERSRRPFILLLMEPEAGIGKDVWKRIQTVVAANVRETDVRGWYRQDSVLGVIFTEVAAESKAIRDVLLAKMTAALLSRLSEEQARQITFSFCTFPDDWDKPASGGGMASASLYPEIRGIGRRRGLWVKRALDIAGSAMALTVASPVFAAIALAVKLTSQGPVLYRQKRVGQYGQVFTFLKFRSMYNNNDPKIHQEYVKSMIAGSAKPQDGASGAGYKLVNDPRITPIGRWLRKTSLDELPQFVNVLLGEMALVGPRPPIPYEVEAYDIWHRRRLLAVKPGITGLWQVTGRSKTTFDEMVRLDLQYAKTWSVWGDIKLLLRTPGAMVSPGAR